MASTFFGLHVGYSGLNAFQASINTTANNISNVQTEGYTRQQVELTPSSAMRVYQKYGSTGTGVTAEGVTQIRDEYYDQKYWYTNPSKGYYDKKVYYLDQIETYYTDDASNPGFSSILGKMFNSLDSVKKNAGDTSVRNEFISNADKLCTYFSSTATYLQELQATINDEIKSTVDNINSITKKVALLNKQINTIEQQGVKANELRDQRALLIDELSSLITVTVEESDVVNSNYPDMHTGATMFKVKVGGQLLVDTYDYNELDVTVRTAKNNQSDVDGLYDVIWKNSQNSFNISNKMLSGSLKSLFEVRDGNDEQNFKGTVAEITVGSEQTALRLEHLSTGKITELNLPDSGSFVVNNYTFTYTDWEAEVDADGVIQAITLKVDQALAPSVQEKIRSQRLEIGSSVNFKGIPYYQNQMNTFLREFAREFNDIHQTGKDLNGDHGVSFFVADDKAHGEGDFSDDYRKPLETAKQAAYDQAIADGKTPEQAQAAANTVTVTFKNSDDTYYRLTALNVDVADALTSDAKKLCTTRYYEEDGTITDKGIAAYDLTEKLLKLESEVTFYKGNGADKFLQCIYADITVDTQECETFLDNYTNVIDAIQAQRDSISGVDEDEEALDLVRFQNAYNLASKVISTMTEMYDQLILNTGV
ncbi:MAG: flagellar hook-associated protein FlgK [Lachnospiraceae bacterium]|nr:flagellar hook-associated protein FlgK [Lachnospiraceae bacterium]